MCLSTGTFSRLTLSSEQLQKNAREGKYMLTVQLEHILNFDEPLSQMLRSRPAQTIPAFERAIAAVYRNHYHDTISEDDNVPKFQLQVNSNENAKMLRDLQSNLMGQLVVVPGIITAASKTMIKSTMVCLRCGNCGHEKDLHMKNGFAGTQLPR